MSTDTHTQQQPTLGRSIMKHYYYELIRADVLKWKKKAQKNATAPNNNNNERD